MSVAEAEQATFVKQAVHFPGWCVVCRGTAGPFWDTGKDLNDVHIYICRRCFGTGNRELGYVKGPRMEMLDHAADRMVEVEKERDEAQVAATKMADALSTEQQIREQAERDRDHLREKINGLQTQVTQIQSLANNLIVTGF